MPGGTKAAEQLLSHTPREEDKTNSLDGSKNKAKKNNTDSKIS